MRNLIRTLVLTPALALTACGGGGGDDGQSNALAASGGVHDEFLLGGGETLHLGALTLEFTSVVEQRCGVGSSAVCVWQGNAQVLLTATQGQLSQTLLLNTFPDYPTSAAFAGHTVELRRLDPQPNYADTGRPALEAYEATLFVDTAP